MEKRGLGWVQFDEEDMRDLYADAVNVETGFYGASLTFGQARLDKKPRALVRIRTSPQMMKVLCLLLRQQIKNYERDMARIEIPHRLAESIGLETTEVY